MVDKLVALRMLCAEHLFLDANTCVYERVVTIASIECSKL